MNTLVVSIHLWKLMHMNFLAVCCTHVCKELNSCFSVWLYYVLHIHMILLYVCMCVCVCVMLTFLSSLKNVAFHDVAICCGMCVIRECSSNLYVGLARTAPPTNTNFRLTFLLTRLLEALYEDLAV